MTHRHESLIFYVPLDLFLQIQDDTGVSYLFVSHDLDVVRHIRHRVAVMYRGGIVEQGPADVVTTSPEHPYTQRLLLASPVPDPDRQENGTQTGTGSWKSSGSRTNRPACPPRALPATNNNGGMTWPQ